MQNKQPQTPGVSRKEPRADDRSEENELEELPVTQITTLYIHAEQKASQLTCVCVHVSV